MINPADYVIQIKAGLATSPTVASFDVVEEKVLSQEGYFRVRARLSNGDFVEAAEYFVLQETVCETRRYRYQWMDGAQQELRKRWDNVEHFPHLPGFPDHVHVGDERNVVSGERLNMLRLLDILEKETHTGDIPEDAGAEITADEATE